MVGGVRIERAEGAPVEPEELDDADGEALVRIARRAVEEWVEHGRRLRVEARGKLGRPGAAFVTLEKRGGEGWELRGCIGVVRPVIPLAEAVVTAAVDAASSDPRFEPLRREELGMVRIEVTVLGSMEPLPRKPHLRPAHVKVGVHGLYVEKLPYAGLLLPQVAVDEGWDPIMFLTWACIKAGLPGTCWLREDVEIYRFKAAIWREAEPRGPIARRDLAREAAVKGVGTRVS
ncbi:TIGR00296 family protein [Aeropyrum camini]|uniref:Protein ACAM_0687 n=2 Tax=Aeropyrum camini TaxID=229980 RepID=U3TCL9_9CREN|nr:TIGR00296 family protein [Aeropyrum camini]BAN90156.1 uncharacterized conserved protein [Aeropyrum camini SY1 = JCM 12091]